MAYLLTCYFQMKALEPEIEYEEQMRDYSMGVIRSILADYDIPTDDVKQLFRFVLAVHPCYSHLSIRPLEGIEQHAAGRALTA